MANAGVLRVPEFQRSFRWDSADVLALFDSILKGYPIGSVLLWRKEAPAARITLGSLSIDTPEKRDALWVVDGQQRITSLVNAVEPAALAKDDRFRVEYLVDAQKFARPNEARGKLSIPLPDLFDISRLLDWLQDNPDAIAAARDLQSITARLRDFRLPASVVEQADETVLRDIFDRINSAGKRLRSAEIFDAIHRASGKGSDDALSIGAIADRIAASTTFGRLDDATAYQAILIRRHPDITRDSHGEFESDRRAASDFPGEEITDGYRRAEEALGLTVSFLSNQAGVPHVSFLPYRFLLLVLVRFFALFPDPHPRNIELLRRWFWIAATKAQDLGLSGSTTIVRSLAGNIVAGQEHESIERLLHSVRSADSLKLPSLENFRTNYASSKIILCSLWWHGPRQFETGRLLEKSEIAVALEGRDTPSEVAVEIFPRSRLRGSVRLSAANRVVAVLSDSSSLLDVLDNRRPSRISDVDRTSIRDSHLITPEMQHMYVNGDYEGFLTNRETLISRQTSKFLSLQTGSGFEPTLPLSSYDLDEDENDGHDNLPGNFDHYSSRKRS